MEANSTNCVFCHRRSQPPVLLETPSLYVVPDKFPLLPGHTLIISHAHLRCHAEFPAEEELEELAGHVRGFLESAYGQPVLMWENGVHGQTVFHAHLHLVPLRAAAFPPEVDRHPDVRAVADWIPAREALDQAGGYRFMRLSEERRLIAGRSPALKQVRRWLAAAGPLRRENGDWVREVGPEAIEDLVARWREWNASAQAAGKSTVGHQLIR